MVYTVFALAAIFSLAGIVFFGFVAHAYLHVPARVEVKVRHSKSNPQR